jgi:hypothetical protein
MSHFNGSNILSNCRRVYPRDSIDVKYLFIGELIRRYLLIILGSHIIIGFQIRLVC